MHYMRPPSHKPTNRSIICVCNDFGSVFGAVDCAKVTRSARKG